MVFVAALLAPLLALLVGLLVLVAKGGVERIAPSESVFRPWTMAPQEPESPDMARALLERPLFWGRRRPLAPEQPAPAVAAAPKKPAGPKKPALAGYRLAGMFSSEFDAGVVVVGPKERRRLVVGQSIDGWMLERVDENGAVFVHEASQGRQGRSTIALKHSTPKAGN